jgi:hypothetical protein
MVAGEEEETLVLPGRRRSGATESEADLEELRPYLGLAREISEHVSRLSVDPTVSPETLAEVLDHISLSERSELVLAAFERLPADAQWSLIERVYGDAEIAGFLADERAARLEGLRQHNAELTIARRARLEQRLDTAAIESPAELTLGLFRESDVRAAVARGSSSATCARRVVLRTGPRPGTFHVVEDVFNPRGGLFVTAEYDHDTWQRVDRLEPNALVRVGTRTVLGDGHDFETVLYPGARTDFEIAGEVRDGRLHLGFALVGSEEIFVPQGGSQ